MSGGFRLLKLNLKLLVILLTVSPLANAFHPVGGCNPNFQQQFEFPFEGAWFKTEVTGGYRISIGDMYILEASVSGEFISTVTDLSPSSFTITSEGVTHTTTRTTFYTFEEGSLVQKVDERTFTTSHDGTATFNFEGVCTSISGHPMVKKIMEGSRGFLLFPPTPGETFNRGQYSVTYYGKSEKVEIMGVFLDCWVLVGEITGETGLFGYGMVPLQTVTEYVEKNTGITVKIVFSTIGVSIAGQPVEQAEASGDVVWVITDTNIPALGGTVEAVPQPLPTIPVPDFTVEIVSIDGVFKFGHKLCVKLRVVNHGDTITPSDYSPITVQIDTNLTSESITGSISTGLFNFDPDGRQYWEVDIWFLPDFPSLLYTWERCDPPGHVSINAEVNPSHFIPESSYENNYDSQTLALPELEELPDLQPSIDGYTPLEWGSQFTFYIHISNVRNWIFCGPVKVVLYYGVQKPTGEIDLVKVQEQTENMVIPVSGSYYMEVTVPSSIWPTLGVEEGTVPEIWAIGIETPEGSESNTENNMDIVFIAGLKPDLTVESIEGDTLLAPGREASWTITLENLGVNPASNIQVRVELYRVEADGRTTLAALIGEYTVEGSIPGYGGIRTVYATWTPTIEEIQEGSYILKATVDPDNQVEEEAEDNNVKTMELQGELNNPPMIVELYISPYSEDMVSTGTYRINIGSEYYLNIVAVELDEQDELQYVEVTYDGVYKLYDMSGSEDSIEVSMSGWFSQPGTYTLTVTVYDTRQSSTSRQIQLELYSIGITVEIEKQEPKDIYGFRRSDSFYYITVNFQNNAGVDRQLKFEVEGIPEECWQESVNTYSSGGSGPGYHLFTVSPGESWVQLRFPTSAFHPMTIGWNTGDISPDGLYKIEMKIIAYIQVGGSYEKVIVTSRDISFRVKIAFYISDLTLTYDQNGNGLVDTGEEHTYSCQITGVSYEPSQGDVIKPVRLLEYYNPASADVKESNEVQANVKWVYYLSGAQASSSVDGLTVPAKGDEPPIQGSYHVYAVVKWAEGYETVTANYAEQAENYQPLRIEDITDIYLRKLLAESETGVVAFNRDWAYKQRFRRLKITNIGEQTYTIGLPRLFRNTASNIDSLEVLTLPMPVLYQVMASTEGGQTEVTLAPGKSVEVNVLLDFTGTWQSTVTIYFWDKNTGAPLAAYKIQTENVVVTGYTHRLYGFKWENPEQTGGGGYCCGMCKLSLQYYYSDTICICNSKSEDFGTVQSIQSLSTDCIALAYLEDQVKMMNKIMRLIDSGKPVWVAVTGGYCSGKDHMIILASYVENDRYVYFWGYDPNTPFRPDELAAFSNMYIILIYDKQESYTVLPPLGCLLVNPSARIHKDEFHFISKYGTS